MKTKTRKQPKRANSNGGSRCVQRLVRQIADELFSVWGIGEPTQMGDRLAVMKRSKTGEISLGGRNRSSVEDVLVRHLSNIGGQPPERKPLVNQ